MAENATRPDSRPAGRAGLYLLGVTGALLVAASWWTSAAASLRILALWAIALTALGRGGQRRLGDGQRAVLAALVAVAYVHLIVFPISGQPLPALALKAAVLIPAWIGLVAVGRSALRPDTESNRDESEAGPSRAPVSVPFQRICLVGAFVASVALGLTLRSARALPAILAPLAYVSIFLLFARGYGESRNRKSVMRWVSAVPVAVALVTAVQLFQLAGAQKRSEKAFKRNRYDDALRWNGDSLEASQRIRLRKTEARLLVERVRILDALDRPEEALATMLRRERNRYFPPSEPKLRELCDAYLTTAPLEKLIVPLSHPAYLWRFDNLPLPEDAGKRSLLLGLFARSGLLDRLLIEYAQCRLDDSLDFAYLRKCLGNEPVWALLLRGICEAKLNNRVQARAHFEQVLSHWPDYHNALVWLQRIEDGSGAGGDGRATTRTGRIENAQMFGNHLWGLNVDDALWTPIEVGPGRYVLHFEVAGLPAVSEWPILTVYLDGALLLEQPVRSKAYTTATCEVAFERDDCHRLVVGFPNDVNRDVGGKNLNRNLYLRRITIERRPRAPQ